MALCGFILERFPLLYKMYVEVFGGAGWVLFRKQPGREAEIFNDFDSDIVNLYRCVRGHKEELKNELRYALNSREEFEYIREQLKGRAHTPDVYRASLFYQCIRYSYASGLTSYGGQPHSIWRDFPLIDQASERLQDVVIENKDCVELIKTRGREDTFFYLDPPYFGTEDYYAKGKGFGKADHQRLADCLADIDGKFLLSYNDCPEIREIYSKPGYCIEQVSRLDNIAQRNNPGKQYSELLIANYDTTERARAARVQPTLFDLADPYEQILQERTMIYGAELCHASGTGGNLQHIAH